MAKIKSQGECIFCNKKFSMSAISRHLDTHLGKNRLEIEPGISFHVRVENDSDLGGNLYFLNLFIDGNTTFKNLDMYLRKIWLECCGHMSAFRYPNRDTGEFSIVLVNNIETVYDPAEIPKSKKVKDVLAKGLTLEYEYDFGSSTELKISVIEKYPIRTEEKIILLSRNEPLPILCDICRTQPATRICVVCKDENESDSLFCDDCSKQHAKTCSDFTDYASMPVVNSPRMGVCGYTGGLMAIEKERDGIYTMSD